MIHGVCVRVCVVRECLCMSLSLCVYVCKCISVCTFLCVYNCVTVCVITSGLLLFYFSSVHSRFACRHIYLCDCVDMWSGTNERLQREFSIDFIWFCVSCSRQNQLKNQQNMIIFEWQKALDQKKKNQKSDGKCSDIRCSSRCAADQVFFFSQTLLNNLFTTHILKRCEHLCVKQ